MPAGFNARTTIPLPSVTVVTASAGAGKTHALAHRYVQLLLSNEVPHNALPNILAITFTNNAAAEMKQRIIRLLKLAALGDEKTLAELGSLVSIRQPEIRTKAARLVDEIFDNYSDFNVKTVDSFMSTVFTSSSIEYGYNPEFEIQLSVDRIFDRAFELFATEIREGSVHASVVEKIVGFLSENRKRDDPFLWNAYGNLSSRVKQIYHMIASRTKPLRQRNRGDEGSMLREKIAAQSAKLGVLIKQSSLSMNRYFAADLSLIHEGNIPALIERKLKSAAVNKPKGKEETTAYQTWIAQIENEHQQLNELLRQFFLYYVEAYYLPYAEAYGMMQQAIGKVKEQYGQIFIDDVNKTLAEHLNAEAVPEIYFKIGETIYHYLVDEFQDTSQIQWRNLFPLIEESLSKGGSLFVVGDTKQSIYGFRDADWTIMKHLIEENPFPSAQHIVTTLGINYRSCEKVIEFNKEIFHNVIPGQGLDLAAGASGLSTFEQQSTPEHRGQGYVDVIVLREEDDDAPEKRKITEVVDSCHSRGYRYNEIAILTPNNANVVEVSGWLNERGIPIISHSTLDVRRRKSAGELIALLRFLDTPMDDLSFATFLLGDLFNNCAAKRKIGITREHLDALMVEEKSERSGPLYAAFRNRYKNVWEEYFEHLFNVVGYLPLYDLLSEAYKIFDLFETSPEEEASLVKLLEVIKTFEQEGTNAIKNFLEYVGDESTDDVWKIDVPGGIDALSVMTIHKAKGIEFPVVIVLLYDQSQRGKSFIVREDEEFVTILKANKTIAENVDPLRVLLDAEQFRDTVDMLNKLYVAFTRAETEMYVVGVFKKESKIPTKFLSPGTYGSVPESVVSSGRAQDRNSFFPFHHRTRKPLPLQSFGPIGGLEVKRGDVVHRVFSLIDFFESDFRRQINSVLQRISAEVPEGIDQEEIRATIVDFVDSSGVGEFFSRKDGRIVLREQDLTNAAGALYRADRIVVDPTKVWAVDFKTGGVEHEADYVGQVRNYMAMMKDIYPGKDVEGVIAYVDMKQAKKIQ